VKDTNSNIIGLIQSPRSPRDDDVMPRRVPVQGRRRAQVRPIGVIRSVIKTRSKAPKQGSENGPDAWLDVSRFAVDGLDGLVVGADIIVVTWFHRARRDVLKVYPRSDRRRPLTGVFATRSPDRPNPLGLHRVTVRRIVRNRLRIGPIEAIDGTPVIDIKPVLTGTADF
jgi:tRNA-Thr(GGU) m(6)t(6)A37 methyltransferase TsaA